MSGHAFEYTPMGLRPAGLGPVVEKPEEPGCSVVQRQAIAPPQPVQQALPMPAMRPVPSAFIDPSAPLDGKALLRQVTDRIKAIRRELAKVPALQSELASLERLRDAAKTAPKTKSNIVRLARGT